MNKLFGAAIVFIGLASSVFGQNLLVNGDFEDFTAPIYGDNLDVDISPWQYPDLTLTHPNNYSQRISVIKLNSSVSGFTHASPPDLNPNAFVVPASDASQIMAQDRHVLRLYRRMPGGQYSETRRLAQFFTAPHTGCAQYGISGKAWDYNFSSHFRVSLFEATDGSTTSFNNPTGGYASQPNLNRIGYSSYQVQNGQEWVPFKSYAAVTAGNIYGFSVLPNRALLDNASVTYVDNSHCPSIPEGTPNAPTVEAELNVIKTCDPIVPVASGPMTMNCQLVVTGNNFTSIDNLRLMDAFGAAPAADPGDALILGTMAGATNITSNQSWSCLEQINNGDMNLAMCEISGADLIAAGGTSTIDMSFDFMVLNAADQVVNCAVIEVEEQPCTNCDQAPAPSEPAAPDMAIDGEGLPDFCVVLDVPDYTGTTTDPVDPSDLDPDITSITKTCEAPVAGMHNGQLGMLWSCQINVTTDTTPFAGSLTVSDFQNLTSGNFGNTSNQITSISSASGNFDCPQGQSCIVSGADFDSNGEVIDVSLFVTSDQLNTAIDNTTYQLQNCAQGSYVTSAGVNQTIAGNCVNAPWEPVSSIAKTCDPVAPVASGPMTMNCQITVTASNLPTDGFLLFGDGFLAPQPASATDVSVNGSMTNITSNEPWTCIDAPSGNGTGYCELSSADLFAAGGTSTVNMSFQFDVENDPAQAVNCVDQYVNGASALDILAGQQNSNGLSNEHLPDICAYVDLPSDPEPTLPTIDLKKSCKEPELTTRNGVLGFNWTCHIYLDISPTPFDGTFTFHEDASNINVGGAEFISASVPCQGIGTDQLSCEMDGATTPASQTIEVELFTAQVDGDTVIEWENCASGTLAVDGSDVLETPKSCADTRIKPVSPPPVEKVNLKKSCTSPQPTVFNGVQGFSWECDIAITAIPAPFAGTFTLDEDASNISIGTAQFTAASVPCQGIGSDHLSCVLDGSTMSSPEIVHVELFTAQVSDTEVIEWENCAKGAANSANGVMGTEASCVQTRIKPVTTTWERPKELFLKKLCGEPEAATHNGVAGVAWSCEITAVALPAPFAGTYTFTEDATGVSGSNNANIIGVHPANNAWSCSPAVPTQQTDCTISGAAFNPSGFETVVFDLFAQTHGKPVEWKNCVSGVYVYEGDKREIKGNCEGMTWKPTGGDVDPTFRIRKECSLVDTTSNAANYACSIYIDQTNSDPFSGTLVVQDLFHYQGGNSTSQYISNMQGLPANWTCDTAPFTNGASCEISAANFMANIGNRIDVQLSIPFNAFAKGGFENCAALELNGEVAANSNCVAIEPPTPGETEYDVTKTCKASGDRQVFSEAMWFQPYQCTITVTTNGVPFTDPIYVGDALTSGGNSGSTQVQNITSTDPWQCIQGPYVSAGTQGAQPGCWITSVDFPHNVGSSTLTVTMMMNAGNALLGTENCANLMSFNPTTGQSSPIDSDCITIFDPAPALEPILDVVKTCEAATQNASGIWEVDCTVTVTGQNLPAGEVIRVMDELTSVSPNMAQSGNISPSNGANSQCGGGLINNGFASGCNIYVDDLVAAGGSMSFDYSGTIDGPGGYILGQGPSHTTGYPQNCAYADISGAGIHGPDNATGKSCVDIPLELSAIIGNPTGPIIETPTPYTPGTTVVEECSTDVLFVVDQSSSMNQHSRLSKTRLAIQAAMNVFEGNGSAASLVTFSNQGQIVVAPAEVIPSGNMLSSVLGLSGVGQTNWADGLAKARIVVTAATKKPLVLFITDGGPNRPLGADQWGVPPIEVAAIRAQGSRVIGIGLNASFIGSALTDVFGPNVINVGNGDVVNPLVNDGIIIPNNVDYAEVFAEIASAYCPTSGLLKSHGTVIDLKLPEQPYLGDDEPVEETTEVLTPTPTLTPTPENPELELIKEATSHCVANRNTQKYDCGFRLTVTNTGQTRHTGPVAISDDFGKPNPTSAKVTSSGGWTCDKPRGGGMACLNRNLDLEPGHSSIIDMTLKIPGLRGGGRFQNCAEIGVGDNRAQRVVMVQEIMNQRGLNAGPVDGQPGRKTYAALTQLQEQLGLPKSREFDDALFTALGITISTQQSCTVVELPVMPAPPLRCDKASTNARGNACVCRYDNMYQRTATSCGCQRGYNLVSGRGCVKKPDPVVTPVLKCHKPSTRLRDGSCECRDPNRMRRLSTTRCGCKNGLPMVNGRCVSIQVNPRSNNDAAEGGGRCRIKIGGICVK